jgi:hypothetical protein
MQISILQGSASGTVVYVETQKPTTNANGLVSIEIGGGTVVNGAFATIDWANGLYFIKTETDPTGGTNYTITGTNQLLSVPYALHAKTAETVTNETDPLFVASPANGIISGDIINWNNKLDVEQDSSVTNEIQALSISNDTVFLSNGGFVKLPIPTGTQAGQMQYWNNTAWVTVAAGTTGQKFTNLNGTPIWIDNDDNIDPTTGQILKDVTSTTGKIWMDRNLGASRVATSVSDTLAYGDLYQWGRGTDGHEKTQLRYNNYEGNK